MNPGPTTPDPASNATAARRSWFIPLLGLVLTIVVAVAVLTTQWQTTLDSTKSNATQIVDTRDQHTTDVDKLENNHDTDIARLDESNRNRRNQIADLEERIARLEATIEVLQANQEP